MMINKPLEKYGINLIALLAIVGIIGLCSPWNQFFLELTVPYLLSTSIVVLFYHDRFNANFFLFAIAAFAIGFGVEVIGVQTGILFGNYTYGEVLGIKVVGVPLMIGLNWMMLIYSTSTMLSHFYMSKFKTALIAAGLLMLLDFVMEPVAMDLDYWQWANGIPLKNYITWFIVSFGLSYIYQLTIKESYNRVAIIWVVSQFAFFTVMNIAKF